MRSTVRFLCAWCGWLLRNPRVWPTVARRTRIMWRQGGLTGLLHALHYKAAGRQAADDADRWYQRTRPSARLLRRLRARYRRVGGPRIVVPYAVRGDDVRPFVELLESLRQQVYPYWQLVVHVEPTVDRKLRDAVVSQARCDSRVEVCSSQRELLALRGTWHLVALADAAARGEYVLLVEAGVSLEPTALHHFAETAARERCEVAYGDEVHLDRCGRVQHVAARPAFSYEYFLATFYFAACALVHKSVLRDAVAAGCEDRHELLLRVIERADRVSHAPTIVSRRDTQALRRAGMRWNFEQRRRAVERHLQRLEIDADVRATTSGQICEVRYRPARRPKVAIIIPTHNGHELLRQCIDSLRRTTDPDLVDLVVVDHESDELPSQVYLGELAWRHRVVRVSGPFNFSHLINRGVAAAGEGYTHYLLLNNDIEAIERGWLERMLSLASRRDVAVVGATLLFPDRTVQHAGVIVGLRGLAGHFFAGLPYVETDDATGEQRAAAIWANREVSAVTGACLLVRADVFHRLGRFDETIAVGYGDVDFCLRCRAAGYQVLMDAGAVLLHHESATRGRTAWDPHPEDTRRFLARHGAIILQGDPYYHPSLSAVLTQSQLAPPRREALSVIPRTLAVQLPQIDRPVTADSPPLAKRSSTPRPAA